MTEPLPNCFSIWPSAATSAFLRLSSIRCVPDEWIKRELSHNESELSRLFAKDSWCFHAEIVALRRGRDWQSHLSSTHFSTVLYVELDAPVLLSMRCSDSKRQRTGSMRSSRDTRRTLRATVACTRKGLMSGLKPDSTRARWRLCASSTAVGGVLLAVATRTCGLRQCSITSRTISIGTSRP